MTKPSKLSDVGAFYAYLRSKKCKLFGSSLSQNQVDGMDGIFAAFAEVGDASPHSLAYILATAYHETGRKMVPVREGFCSTDAGSIRAVTKLFNRGKIKTNYALPDPVTGFSYFGRGHVQLTWPPNYKKMGKKIGVDLYRNPDLALDPVISAKVLVRGSLDGDFTGKRLDDYLPHDEIGARRVINGRDKAQLISGYYHYFLKAIYASGSIIEVLALNWQPPERVEVEIELPSEDKPQSGGIVGTIVEVLAMIFARLFGGKNG